MNSTMPFHTVQKVAAVMLHTSFNHREKKGLEREKQGFLNLIGFVTVFIC